MSFIYKHINNHAKKTLFLFHGTGGDETDFLFLDASLNHQYNLVGLRGNIQENGMNRFFKRLEFGVFDEENIKQEVEKLKQFIEGWKKVHSDEILCLGYSNGANMILALLFSHPELVQKAALLHPMLPFSPPATLNLAEHTVFVSYGNQDQMISVQKSEAVVKSLINAGAALTTKEYSSDHGISQEELHDVLEFINHAE